MVKIRLILKNYQRKKNLKLIDTISAEGANNMIVVDGEAWGKDYHTQTIAARHFKAN